MAVCAAKAEYALMGEEILGPPLHGKDCLGFRPRDASEEMLVGGERRRLQLPAAQA